MRKFVGANGALAATSHTRFGSPPPSAAARAHERNSSAASAPQGYVSTKRCQTGVSAECSILPAGGVLSDGSLAEGSFSGDASGGEAYQGGRSRGCGGSGKERDEERMECMQ